jgi:hypothetical protein
LRCADPDDSFTFIFGLPLWFMVRARSRANSRSMMAEYRASESRFSKSGDLLHEQQFADNRRKQPEKSPTVASIGPRQNVIKIELARSR